MVRGIVITKSLPAGNHSNKRMNSGLFHNTIEMLLERTFTLHLSPDISKNYSWYTELLVDADPMVLQEHEWKCTLASELNKILAVALGIVNLGGAAYLGTLFTQLDMAVAASNTLVLPGWISIVKGFYPALLGYDILYNMIPLVCKFWLDCQNIQIQK